MPRVLESPARPNSVTQWSAIALRFLDVFRKPDGITHLNPAWTDFMVWRALVFPARMETRGRRSGGRKHTAPPFRPADLVGSLGPQPAFFQAREPVECGHNSRCTFRTQKKHSSFFFPGNNLQIHLENSYNLKNAWRTI